MCESLVICLVADTPAKLKYMTDSITILQKQINDNSIKKGYWNEGVDATFHKKLLLIISEAVEAMEADRKGRVCQLDDITLAGLLQDERDDVFKDVFENNCKHTYPDEIADLVIRTLDLAYMTNVNLPLQIALKMRYNKLNDESSIKKY